MGTLRTIDESAARRRRKTPQQSAERRARARVMGLGDLRRSGDRPDREAGHRVRRFRTSACRRSAPPLYFRGAKTDEGHPPPANRAGAALAKAGSKGVWLKLARGAQSEQGEQ